MFTFKFNYERIIVNNHACPCAELIFIVISIKFKPSQMKPLSHIFLKSTLFHLHLSLSPQFPSKNNNTSLSYSFVVIPRKITPKKSLLNVYTPPEYLNQYDLSQCPLCQNPIDRSSCNINIYRFLR